MLCQKRVFDPGQHPPAALCHPGVHAVDIVHPDLAAVDLIVGFFALIADSCVINLISGGMEIFHPGRGVNHVLVHVEYQADRLLVAHAGLVVACRLGFQMLKFGVLEHVSHMRRGLDHRNELDVALQGVAGKLVHFLSGVSSRGTDYRMARVLVLILHLESDTVDLEQGQPVQQSFNGPGAFLVVLGVPVHETKLQVRPVDNRACRHGDRSGGIALHKLQNALHTVEQALVSVAGYLDPAACNLDFIGLRAQSRIVGLSDSAGIHHKHDPSRAAAAELDSMQSPGPFLKPVSRELRLACRSLDPPGAVDRSIPTVQFHCLR